MRCLRCANIPIIRRWLRFNAVGAMGICVQIAAACGSMRRNLPVFLEWTGRSRVPENRGIWRLWSTKWAKLTRLAHFRKVPEFWLVLHCRWTKMAIACTKMQCVPKRSNTVVVAATGT